MNTMLVENNKKDGEMGRRRSVTGRFIYFFISMMYALGRALYGVVGTWAHVVDEKHPSVDMLAIHVNQCVSL